MPISDHGKLHDKKATTVTAQIVDCFRKAAEHCLWMHSIEEKTKKSISTYG